RHPLRSPSTTLFRSRLGLVTPSFHAVTPGLMPGMLRLRRRHHPSRLALQIQTRGILGHGRPIATTATPGGNTKLELLEADAEQGQMLLGILEDALFQRYLGRRIDREGQRKVLLQPPDRFDGRILLARLGFLRRLGLALWRLRVFGLYLL